MGSITMHKSNSSKVCLEQIFNHNHNKYSRIFQGETKVGILCNNLKMFIVKFIVDPTVYCKSYKRRWDLKSVKATLLSVVLKNVSQNLVAVSTITLIP